MIIRNLELSSENGQKGKPDYRDGSGKVEKDLQWMEEITGTQINMCEDVKELEKEEQEVVQEAQNRCECCNQEMNIQDKDRKRRECIPLSKITIK